MNGLQFDKFLTAFFSSCLVLLVIGNSVDAVFASNDKKEHSSVQNHAGNNTKQVGAPSNASSTDGIVSLASAADKPASDPGSAIDISALMAKADATKGKSLSRACAACHTFDKGQPNRVGPNLWNIVASNKAHLGSGFNYSKAMLAKGGKWSEEDLIHFLHKPTAFVKGTRMMFAGLQNLQDAANMVAFLKTKSDAGK